jgi:predicted DNA-binding transcriptional regulator AlpA
VLDWFEAGRLPGFKLGRAVRFPESEVLDWLEAQRVGPPPRLVEAGSLR